jgi:hypothetical protein
MLPARPIHADVVAVTTDGAPTVMPGVLAVIPGVLVVICPEGTILVAAAFLRASSRP